MFRASSAGNEQKTDRTTVEDAASNAQAPAQGTALTNSRPETLGQGEEAREAFLHMMSNWVFDELLCTPEECLKFAPEECLKFAVSLLRDSDYQWWNTLVSVVPKERVSREFFQEEYWKKYISQKFIDHKRKEFLKYTRECISTEATMCKRFEDGLNEDIHLYVGVLDLKEFVVLLDRAYKAKELAKEKRRAENESRDPRKRQLNKSLHSSSKKLRDFAPRSDTSAGFSNRSKGKQFSGPKRQTTLVASVGNVRPSRPKCPQCGRRHSGECRANEKTCFRCGSLDHFIRDCLEVGEKEKS
ncbi:Gag-Pol polyprotein [Gossypium australe]|uniref:Gag-Pol polyprotein n=1 Tax=Gossypium australe TaxID=47621 RepID=A0A5B6VP13_9ROSI|nr:Gag-Pol polyprotein [Gossypium australe]